MQETAGPEHLEFRISDLFRISTFVFRVLCIMGWRRGHHNRCRRSGRKFSLTGRHVAFLQRIFDSTGPHCPFAKVPPTGTARITLPAPPLAALRMQPRSNVRLVAVALAGLTFWLAAAAVGSSPAACTDSAVLGNLADFLGHLSLPEERLLADVAEGRFQETSLFAAALLASGEREPAGLKPIATSGPHYLGNACVRHGPSRARQQAQAVLAFLHGRVLRGGYDLASTDLRQALDHGRFNCVGASLLFHCLAAEFALPVGEVAIPGHVKSRVRLAAGSFDVETTCPRWFDMSPNAQAKAEIAARAQLGPAAGGRTAAGNLGRGARGNDLLQPGDRSAGPASFRRGGRRQRHGPAARSGQCHDPRQSPGDREQLGHRPGRRSSTARPPLCSAAVWPSIRATKPSPRITRTSIGSGSDKTARSAEKRPRI